MSDALLHRLLAAWRATRDPALEPIIERAGKSDARPPIAAKSKAELETRWLAIAAACDPADLARLLDTPWSPAWRTALPRAEALARFEPDPRISIAVARLARTYVADASRPLHDVFGDLLARAPTAQIAPDLDAFAAAARMIRNHYADVRRMLEAPTSHAPAALLAEANAQLGTPADLDALWAAHLADPADAVHRRVLADALEVAGDPRGQFIQLQLAADPASLRKADALLQAHARAWIGPLPGIDVKAATFARGFLVAATTDASGALLERAIDRPEWVTLERLAIRHDTDGLAPLIARMPLLARLAAPARVLASLAACPAETVVWLHGDPAWRPSRDVFPRLAVCGWKWHYRWGATEFRERQAIAAALDVTAVYLGMRVEAFAEALAMRGAVPRETRFSFDGLDELDAGGWCVRMQRDGGAIAITERRRRVGEDLSDILAALAAAGATRIAIDGKVPPGVRGASTRRGLTLVAGEPFDVLVP